MAGDETSASSLSPQRKTFRVGMWAAIVITITPILSAGLVLGSIYGGMLFNQFGSRSLFLTVNLFGYLQSVLSLVETLAFVIVIACLRSYAPAEKRIWIQIGFIIAVIYALVVGINFIGGLAPNFHLYILERVFPAMDSRLRPMVFVTLVSALMGLAVLLAIPAFTRGGLERIIRWCLAISGVLLIACGVGMVLGLGMQTNAWLSIGTMLIRITVFPLATVLIAVVFRRAEKMKPGAELSLQDQN